MLAVQRFPTLQRQTCKIQALLQPIPVASRLKAALNHHQQQVINQVQTVIQVLQIRRQVARALTA